MTKKTTVDWEAVERDYRAGVMSLREIGDCHGCTHTAVRNKAKELGWTRDLNAKIKAKADALVSKAVVSAELSAERAASEQQTIDANAQAISQIRLAHRADIRAARELSLKMLAELQGVHARPDLIEALQEALAGDPDEVDPDERKRRVQQMKDALHRIASLPGQVSALKALSDTLKTLIELERKAWGLDDPDGGADRPPPAMGDAALAAKLAYFVELGRRRMQDNPPEGAAP